MIEFKAECGHTVRAKDEDAGGVVRCTYCGRQAAVPDARADGLDFLFNDVVQPEEAAGGRRGRRKRRRERAAKAGGLRRSDPFSIILRMCYAALLLIVVIVVGRKYVLPLFEDGGMTKRVASRVAERKPAATTVETAPPAPPRRNGLVTEGNFIGLYITSVPDGAAVYALDESKAPPSGRIHTVPGVVTGRANGAFLRLPDANYVVEVVLPWSDPQLNDPSLPNYDNYRNFRHLLEEASDEERRTLLESYFIPDEANSVFVDQTPEQIYLVRQYRGIAVQGGHSKGVRALFLPKIATPGHASFAVAPLVTHYIPKREMYGFNEEHVRGELDFREVPVADRLFVVEALKRIGVVPYVTPDGRTRLFKIGIEEGEFASKVIREAAE